MFAFSFEAPDGRSLVDERYVRVQLQYHGQLS